MSAYFVSGCSYFLNHLQKYVIRSKVSSDTIGKYVIHSVAHQSVYSSTWPTNDFILINPVHPQSPSFSFAGVKPIALSHLMNSFSHWPRINSHLCGNFIHRQATKEPKITSSQLHCSRYCPVTNTNIDPLIIPYNLPLYLQFKVQECYFVPSHPLTDMTRSAWLWSASLID